MWLYLRVVGASRFPYEMPLEHSLSTLSRSPEIIFYSYKLDYLEFNSANLINITADHVKHGVEHLDIELLHSEQLLLGLVEGERARVHPPQPVAGDDGGHGRGEVGPVTLLMIIIL